MPDEEANTGRRTYDKSRFAYLCRKVEGIEVRVNSMYAKINNGFADAINHNQKRLDNLEHNYFKLLWALGGCMVGIIVLLLSILSRVW